MFDIITLYGEIYTNSLSGYTVTVVGYYVNIVYGGLTFRYTDDFDFYLSVAESALPSDRSVLKGLCGNYNGDYEDDMYLLGGNRATSVAAYGNSYALTTVSGPVSIYIMLVREILTLRINLSNYHNSIQM